MNSRRRIFGIRAIPQSLSLQGLHGNRIAEFAAALFGPFLAQG